MTTDDLGFLMKVNETHSGEVQDRASSRRSEQEPNSEGDGGENNPQCPDRQPAALPPVIGGALRPVVGAALRPVLGHVPLSNLIWAPCRPPGRPGSRPHQLKSRNHILRLHFDFGKRFRSVVVASIYYFLVQLKFLAAHIIYKSYAGMDMLKDPRLVFIFICLNVPLSNAYNIDACFIASIHKPGVRRLHAKN
jgi:hypothetical protein